MSCPKKIEILVPENLRVKKSEKKFCLKKRPCGEYVVDVDFQPIEKVPKINVPPGYIDEETNDEKLICVICLENKKCCLLLPCYHLCLCSNCVSQNKKEIEEGDFSCPLCRVNVKSVNIVYS